jgi:hypothetical protein
VGIVAQLIALGFGIGLVVPAITTLLLALTLVVRLISLSISPPESRGAE